MRLALLFITITTCAYYVNAVCYCMSCIVYCILMPVIIQTLAAIMIISDNTDDRAVN